MIGCQTSQNTETCTQICNALTAEFCLSMLRFRGFMRSKWRGCMLWLLIERPSSMSLREEVFRMEEREQQRVPGRYGFDEIRVNQLEPWPNAHADRDYVTHFEIPEFTCLCPRS